MWWSLDNVTAAGTKTLTITGYTSFCAGAGASFNGGNTAGWLDAVSESECFRCGHVHVRSEIGEAHARAFAAIDALGSNVLQGADSRRRRR